MRRLAGATFAGFTLLVAAEACARAEAPSGGPEDRFPPYVIETVPDTFAIVEPGLREIRFCFSERISERPADGRLNDAVVVSPATGEIRVKHGRECITVEMEEGLAPDLVYRITVLPIINDMFSNSLRDPFDLVVSTGAEIVPNVVAGMVEDRVTGDATPSARVEARFPYADDTLTHWNVADAGGVFSLRYTPAGPCELRAWQDQNRNGEADESEPQTSFIPCDLPEPPDTTLEILTLIQPDTTAPRLTRVNIEDSVTLRIEFDDYIEPTIPVATIRGTLTVAEYDDSVVAAARRVGAGEGEGGEAGDTAGAGEVVEVVDDPGEVVAAGDSAPGQEAGTAQEEPVPLPEPGHTVRIRIFQEHEYQAWLAFREDSIARADSIAREEEARAAEMGDSAAPGEPAAETEEPAGQQALPGDPVSETGEVPAEDPDSADGPTIATTLSGLRLPASTLVGVLDEALVPHIPYELVVEGVANIAGADGGGGVDTLTWEPPPPEEEEETEVGDSVPVDDTATVDDTTTVQPDTVTPPDTLTPPDTNRVTPRAAGDRAAHPPFAAAMVPAPDRGAAGPARPTAPFRHRRSLRTLLRPSRCRRPRWPPERAPIRRPRTVHQSRLHPIPVT